MKVLKVSVVAYKGKLVVCPDKPEEGVDQNWWPTAPGKLGCVVGDTKNLLGCSKEALDLMRKVENGHDAIGDIDWWAVDDGTYAFAWFGAIYRIIDVATAIGARGFRPYPDQCTIIPNNVPKAAKEAVTKGEFHWNTPLALEK